MKCIICDSKGAYRLRVDSDDWQTPLQIDGTYCSHDLTAMIDEVKRQVQAQVPNFAIINNVKPATPLPIYTGEPVRPPVPAKVEMEIEEEDEDAEDVVPPNSTPPTPTRPDVDWSQVVQINIRKHIADRILLSKDAIEKRREKVKAYWERGVTNTYEIADLLDCGRGAIYADLRVMGIKPKVAIKKREIQHYIESTESESVAPILQVQ